jgi:hypothetical protein
MHAAQGCDASLRQVIPIVIVRLHAAPCVVQTKPAQSDPMCELQSMRTLSMTATTDMAISPRKVALAFACAFAREPAWMCA